MEGIQMKDKALEYLIKDSLLHMGMIEPIHRGTAEILYAEIDGVLLKEQKSDSYMISIDNFEKGKELLNTVSNCNLIVAHQRFMVDYILKKHKLTETLECVQAVYADKTKFPISNELEIRKLEPKHKKVILEHYDKIPDEEIQELLNDGSLFGGYKNNELIGFIGNHLEGSIGLLEVFPEYRRLGYGTILEKYMINRMLEKALVPFAQIVVDNDKSIALQKKLGFSISKDSMFWMW